MSTIVLDDKANKRLDDVWDDIVNENPPRWKLTKREAEALIGDFNLCYGGGGLVDPETESGWSNRKEVNQICVMQAANIYNAVLEQEKVLGGPITPSYTDIDEVDPVIEQMMISLNDIDTLMQEERNQLIAFVPKLLGTRVDEKTSRRTEIAREVIAQVAWEDFKAHGDQGGHVVEAALEEMWDPPIINKDDETYNLKKVRKAPFIKALKGGIDPLEALDHEYMKYVYDMKGFDYCLKFIKRLLRGTT